MITYPKINSIFKRTDKGKIILGEYSAPMFEKYKDNIWYIDEKIDGTNIRIHWKDGVVTYGGRTDHAQLHAGLVAHLNDLFIYQNKIRKLMEFADEGIIFCEGVGPGIQRNKYKLEEYRIYVFDVIINHKFISINSIACLCDFVHINCVPRHFPRTLSRAITEMSIGRESSIARTLEEGIVARVRDASGNRLIVKIKNKDMKDG